MESDERKDQGSHTYTVLGLGVVRVKIGASEVVEGSDGAFMG